MQPGTFGLRDLFTQVKQHHDKDKQDHNGAGIYDHFERGDERSAKRVENDGYSEQRDDQIEQRMDRIRSGQHHDRRNYRHSSSQVKHDHHGGSRQKAVQIHWPRLVLRFAFVFSAYLDSGNTPKIVTRILAGSVNEKIFFFIDHVLSVVLSHFKIRSKLDCVSGTGFLTVAAENAA